MIIQSDILVIDVETFGLNPTKNACIELGAVHLNVNLDPINEFSTLIAPWAGSEIVPEALRVNGIDLESLNSAPQISEVVELFHANFRPDINKLLLCGWNVWLDVAFLRDLYVRGNRKWPFGHRLLDMQSVVTFHSNLIPRSQAEVIKSLLNENQSHRALEDAQQTAKILRFFNDKFFGKDSKAL